VFSGDTHLIYYVNEWNSTRHTCVIGISTRYAYLRVVRTSTHAVKVKYGDRSYLYMYIFVVLLQLDQRCVALSTDDECFEMQMNGRISRPNFVTYSKRHAYCDGTNSVANSE